MMLKSAPEFNEVYGAFCYCVGWGDILIAGCGGRQSTIHNKMSEGAVKPSHSRDI